MDCLLLLCHVDRTIGYDGRGDFLLERDGRLIRQKGSGALAYIGGYLVQRSGAPRLTANLSYLAAALALLALYLGASPVLACLAFGVALGPGPGILNAMPSRVLRRIDQAAKAAGESRSGYIARRALG